jgi:hypothetical protein
MLKSHVFLMFLYAVLSGVFFALLWKQERRDRIRLFLIVFLSLFAGGIAVAWLMYPFPLR